MKHLYLIRHPRPDIEPGICYGQTDMPAQAEDLKRAIQHISQHLPLENKRLFSSPLKRCAVLANALSEKVEIHSAIIEMHFGQWENVAWEDIPHSEINAWRDDMLDFTPPEGESVRQMRNRVSQFIEQYLHTADEDCVLFTHAGVIRCFLDLAGHTSLSSGKNVTLDYAAIQRFSLHQGELNYLPETS